MMDDLRDLYQEVILDHGKNPGTSVIRRTATARPRATTRCAATSCRSI